MLNILRSTWPYAYVALVAVVLLAASWQWGYMARGAAEADRAAKAAAAVQAAADEHLAAALAAQQEIHAEQLAAAEKRATARQKASKKVSTIVEEIRNEPTSSQCINSPAVQRAIARLRALDASHADSSH